MAADQGDAHAQKTLESYYFDGDGVENDKAKAVKYYHLSANEGNAAAKNDLWKCFLKGWGVF